jgi:hypothetical protein
MPAVGAVPPTPPIYHAAPPEVHSTLLNTGATAAGVTVAGTSWTQLAAQYVAGIAELEAILAQVQATYQGPTAEKFVAAHQPMLMWMADVVAKATLAAAAHGEIAAAYTTAVIMMPTMPELITNHVVHGVLVATNFFGVNTIPIGMNEADYIRMWNQAADTQSTYDGVTAMAVDSIPDTPPSPITLIPGVGEAGNIAATAAGFTTQALAQTSGAALNAGDLMSSKLLAGKAATSPLSVANRVPDGPTSETQNAANDAGQQLKPENMGSVLQQFTSIASSAPQAASSAIQAPANMLMQAPQQRPGSTRRGAARRVRRHRRDPGFQPGRNDQPGRRRTGHRPFPTADALHVGVSTGQRRGIDDQRRPRGVAGGGRAARGERRRRRQWRWRHDGPRREQQTQPLPTGQHVLR